jgi:hypothetical protein
MMGIDVQIAGRLDVQVDQAVPGQQGQHVVEESDPGVDRPLAGAIQIQSQFDSRFAGFPS